MHEPRAELEDSALRNNGNHIIIITPNITLRSYFAKHRTTARYGLGEHEWPGAVTRAR